MKCSACWPSMRAQPILRVTPPYYDDPDYIEALAVSINAHLATLPFQPEIIVASFHGMPQKYVDKGDPYQAQCLATTDAFASAWASMLKADAHIPVALRLRPVAAALYRQDHRATGERRRTPHCRSDPRLLRRLPGDAGRDRAGKRRDFQAQWRRTIRRHPLPERQRSRHGRDPPAGACASFRAGSERAGDLHHEAAGIPFGPCRHSGLADCSACAAVCGTRHRLPASGIAGSKHRASGGISQGSRSGRIGRRSKHCRRVPLGCRAVRQIADARGRSGRTAGRGDRHAILD